MKLRYGTLAGAVAVVAVGMVAACSHHGFSDGDDGGDASAARGDETPLGNGDGPTSCDLTCSADLRAVVDCNGQLVKACPADKTCAGGDCLLPCDAAKVNKSSVGCEYYSVDPDSIIPGGCLAAFVANPGSTPITIKVERGGQPFDVTKFGYLSKGSGPSLTYSPLSMSGLPPGEVAILFLSGNSGGGSGFLNPNCPAGVTSAMPADAAVHKTGIGQAFHITTSDPVVAYDIVPYGGGQSAATGATLLIPTSAWDTNYITVSAYKVLKAYANTFQPLVEIVAQEDGTTLTISPTVDIVGGAGVAPTSKGVPHTYALNKGQVLQFVQPEELTGSPIQSNKPIGLWGGATCMYIGADKGACDAAHAQIPPVHALGHEYAAVRYRNRYENLGEESVPWRFVGAVDGTTLTYEPNPPMGAPTSLASGQLVELWAPGPFIVRSQDDKHPFYLSAHMSGCEQIAGLGAGSDCRGDPEFVNVIPPDQYLARYMFFTDPTYPETNLVVVRKKASGMFQDVVLDCAGSLGGWQPLGADFQFTRVDLSRHVFQAQGACNNGRHEMHSAAPFGLTVWGWGSAETGALGDKTFSQAVSYAYPAGANVRQITSVVVPPTPH